MPIEQVAIRVCVGLRGDDYSVLVRGFECLLLVPAGEGVTAFCGDRKRSLVGGRPVELASIRAREDSMRAFCAEVPCGVLRLVVIREIERRQLVGPVLIPPIDKSTTRIKRFAERFDAR